MKIKRETVEMKERDREREQESERDSEILFFGFLLLEAYVRDNSSGFTDADVIVLLLLLG